MRAPEQYWRSQPREVKNLFGLVQMLRISRFDLLCLKRLTGLQSELGLRCRSLLARLVEK